MAVFKVKEYKKVNGTKIRKTEDELRKQTCNLKKWWYFSVWYLDILGNRKKKRSKQFTTKKEAEAAEIQFLLKYDSSSSISNDMTIEELGIEYIKSSKKNKESTIYGSNGILSLHIIPFFKSKKAKNLTLNDMQLFNTYLLEKTYIRRGIKHHYSIKTINKIYYCLVVILDYGFSRGIITQNVARIYGKIEDANDEVTDKTKIRYFTLEEYNYLEDIIDDIVYKSFFNFAFWQGVRKGEQQALTWKDIDMKIWKVNIIKNLSVKVRGGGYKITNTKNRRNREIDILPESQDLLKKLYNYYQKFDGFNDDWFVWGGVRFLPQTSIDRNLKKFYRKLKDEKNITLRDLSHHELGRHSHASYLRSIGVSIERIAERLGDTVRVVEDTYAHLYRKNEKSLLLLELETARKKLKDFYQK